MNAEEFRDILLESGLTQETAAQVLGVTRGTIYNWLKGNNIPSSKFSAIRNLVNENISASSYREPVLDYDKDKIIRHIAENRDDYINDPLFTSMVGLIEVGMLREENAKIRKALLELTERYQQLAQSLKVGK